MRQPQETGSIARAHPLPARNTRTARRAEARLQVALDTAQQTMSGVFTRMHRYDRHTTAAFDTQMRATLATLDATEGPEDAPEVLRGHDTRVADSDRCVYGSRQIDELSHRLDTHPDVPLCVHARYSRVEILAAFGIGETAKLAPWQTGVYWARDARADLFAFTLDKTTGQFSPTTRYRDYAISRELIHWESQSTTRGDSETGQRYQRHGELGTSVMLFARLRSEDRAFWFLGPASYVSHESELPMAITWRLKHLLPGDLFVQFAAAVA